MIRVEEGRLRGSRGCGRVELVGSAEKPEGDLPSGLSRVGVGFQSGDGGRDGFKAHKL